MKSDQIVPALILALGLVVAGWLIANNANGRYQQSPNGQWVVDTRTGEECRKFQKGQEVSEEMLPVTCE